MFSNEAVTSPITQYLINVESDKWNFYWGTGYNNVYRQYTYDVTVIDGNGFAIPNANVTLKDNTGRGVFSLLTNSTGQIPSEIVSRGVYNVTGGDTMYDFGPFTLTATASGYSNYNSQVTFTRPAISQITLQQNGTVPIQNSTPFVVSRFTFSPSNPTVGQAVSFDGSVSRSSDAIQNYTWNFGDGVNRTGLVTVTHSYASPGDYTVTLTIISADGADSFSQVVTVSAVQQSIMVLPWWWFLVILALVLLLLLLLLLLFMWRRRDVVIIQTRSVDDDQKCSGEEKCDDCKVTPC